MGAFWLVLIGLIVWLVVKLLPGSDPKPAPRPEPLEILDRRLAGGEIDLDTWQAQRAVLGAVQGQGR